MPRKRPLGVWDFKREGTWGHEVADELGPLETERRFLKFRSSAFVGTSLDLYLRSAEITTAIVWSIRKMRPR